MTGLFSRSNEFVVLMRVFHHDKWPFSIPFDYFNIFLHFGFSGKKIRNSIYEDKIERNFVKRTANALYRIYFELFSSNHFKRFEFRSFMEQRKSSHGILLASRNQFGKRSLWFSTCVFFFFFIFLLSLVWRRFHFIGTQVSFHYALLSYDRIKFTWFAI